MSKIRKQSFFVPTPETFVKYALNTVGLESQTSGYPSHSLLVCFTFILDCPSNSKCLLTCEWIMKVAQIDPGTGRKEVFACWKGGLPEELNVPPLFNLSRTATTLPPDRDKGGLHMHCSLCPCCHGTPAFRWLAAVFPSALNHKVA